MKQDKRCKYRLKRYRLHPEIAVRDGSEEYAVQEWQEALVELAGVRQALSRVEAEKETLRCELSRARADREDFRKRTEREKDELRTFGAAPLIEALMPTLDAFDQALLHMQAAHDAEGMSDGVQAIRSLLENALGQHGLEKVQAKGQTFDPNVHEALAVVHSEEHAENTVVDVLQRGYRLHGRLLRAAKVRVARKPE